MRGKETAPELEIGQLANDDRDDWERLWKGYLKFYGATVPDAATQTTWQRIQDPHEPVNGLGCFFDGRLGGIVHYIFHRSTWTPGPYCYLQDLFTAPEFRGRGAGQALIEAVYERAHAQQASRVYWLTHKDNTVARGLYDKVARDMGFMQYRMDLPAGK